MTLIAALVGAVLSGCGQSGAYATQKNFITIGCVCPLTGELASYGEGTLETEEASVSAINESGGIYIDTLQRKLKIRFLVEDSKSTEQGAKDAAEKLIEEQNVDIMICSSGVLTASAAASVCEKAEIPFFSVNAENDAWLEKGPYRSSFNCSYDNTARLEALKDVWDEMGITSVGLLGVQSEDAEQFAGALADFGGKNGITVVNPGLMDPSSPNYAAAAAALSSAKVQALICFMDCDDFSAVYGNDAVKGISPQMCVLMNNHLFGGDIADIKHGAEIKEFYTVAGWDRSYPFDSSLTDESGSELGLWWDDIFLSSASEMLGYKHGNVELAIDAVKLAMALDAESIVSAAKSLDVDTLLGEIDYDSTDNTCVIPCSVIKWTFDTSTVNWMRELYSHSQLKEVEFDED